VQIVNASLASADPRVLAAVAGERSFEDGDDMCNSLFFGLGKALAVVWGLIFLVVIMVGVKKCRGMKNKGRLVPAGSNGGSSQKTEEP